MGEKKLRLRILTPTRTVADESCDMVVMRTLEGDMAVLFGHEPYSAPLGYGVLRAIREGNPAGAYAVIGGFAQIYDNQVVILSSIADTPENIDKAIENIRKAKDENVLLEQNADFEMNRAETALRRSLVRYEGSAFAIIKGKSEKDG
jgi:F-type H+-transporting ATPase subunit epsilon